MSQEDRIKRTSILILFAVLISLGVPAGSFPSAAAPLAQTTSAWTGSYFGNRNLQGSPVFTREDPEIDFTWASGSPDPSLSADNFSVRWIKWVSIDTPGSWTFTAIADDGVRLFIDDVLVIDAWSDQPVAAHTVSVNLTQAYHLVRLEYYDHTGTAEVHLQMISAGFPDWRGEYFGNRTLTGAPGFVRNDSAINFNFTAAGPGGGIPGENFSVRWTRSQAFDAGRYRFTTRTDDGVRLWVDNQLIIDQWHDQTPTNWTGDVTLAAGSHLLKMEYFNRGGTGLALLSWVPVPGSAQVWHGEFFDNPGLGGSPAFSRDMVDLNLDWGTTAPGPGIRSQNNWGARFTSRRVVSLAGFYTVMAAADDGVRVWVDNNILVDEWHDQPPTPYAATVYLQAGPHDWRVDYYQHGGSASLQVQIIAGVVPAPDTTDLASSSALGDVIVEDNGPGFFKAGTSANWREYPAGSANHAYWLQNNTFSQPLYNWARWYPRLSRPGLYEVSAHIPGNLGTTRNARYWIYHGETYDLRNVNQSLYTNQWVSLGTFDFAATGGEYVSLADITYEPFQSTVISVDAIKFSPR